MYSDARAKEEAHSALEQVITAQRAKLVSAHAVQMCLHEVLLYADGEDAVMYAEAAHVVAVLMENVLDNLDPLHLRHAMEEDGLATRSET